MSNFYQAVLSLIESVQTAPEDATRCSQTLIMSQEFDAIDWLDAQPAYPKFYWRSRDEREEVIALGQVRHFTHLTPAYELIRGEQRIWGGCAFDGGTKKNPECPASFFFLPVIELSCREHQWQIAVNWDGDRSLCIEHLQQLVVEPSVLTTIQANIRHVEHCPSFSQWQTLIHQVLDGIEHHQFKKVVLARETTLTLEGPLRAAQLLKQSRQKNKDSFHFLFGFSEYHHFVGSTPERLYRRIGRTLYTEALAGTGGRGKTVEEDTALANWLLHDDKNLNENQYVVDDIISRLTGHVRSIEVTPKAELVTLRKVRHLIRRIEAILKEGVHGEHLLQALQPTAAIAGLPRKPAKAFIEQFEPFTRGWYAGAIGFVSQDDAEFCVSIRSAVIKNDTVKLYAGAGIVPGSDPEAEWVELDKKLSTLLSLISLTNDTSGESA